MSYLLVQILICLLIAGLIGALIGWLLRGGCKRKLRENDDRWSAKYDSDKAIWQGKIDAAESHIKNSLHRNNSDWSLKLKELESNWESKVQNLISDYDSKNIDLNEEVEALKADLRYAYDEVEQSKLKLAELDEKWKIKLDEVESNYENRIKNIVDKYKIESNSGNKEIDLLKDELKETTNELDEARSKLTQLNSEWSFRLKDKESSWENRLQNIVGEYDSKRESNDIELQRVKEELNLSKKSQQELKDKNDDLNLRLRDIELKWEAKLKELKSEQEQNVNKANEEIRSLRSELEETRQKVKNSEYESKKDEYRSKSIDNEDLWDNKVQALMSNYDLKESELNKESSIIKHDLNNIQKIDKKDGTKGELESNRDLQDEYDIEEIEGIGPGYGKRLRKIGLNTTSDLANKFLNDNRAIKKASKKIGVEFDVIKSWASMADLMRIAGVGGQYAEIMQIVGISSREDLANSDLNKLYKDMLEFNTKKPIVPDVPTIKMLKEWVDSCMI